MNDQLIMNNYLLVLKSTTEVYVHGTLESSNVDIRELLKEDLNTANAMTVLYDVLKDETLTGKTKLELFKKLKLSIL